MKMTLFPGVYSITNIVNGKRYIGSASNCFKERWTEHLRRLRTEKHCNCHLQFAWVKYGESAFRFEVLVVCEPADCIPYEQKFIDYFDAVKTGYNLKPTAGSNLGYRQTTETKIKIGNANRGRKKSPETIRMAAEASRGRKKSSGELMKLSVAGRGRQHSVEAKLKMSLAKRGVKFTAQHIENMKGRKCSVATLERMAAAQRGKKQSPECIERKASALRGRKHSPERVAKLAAALRGRKHSPESRKAMSVAQLKWRDASRKLKSDNETKTS